MFQPLRLAGLCLLPLMLTACGPQPTSGIGSPPSAAGAAPADAAPVVFKLQTGIVESSPFTVGGFKPMAREIERQTAGAVKFELYHGTTLGGVDKHYDMVQSGTVDAAWVIPSYFPSSFKLTSVVYLPFAVRTAVEGSTAISTLYQAGHFGKEFENFEPIMWTSAQPSVIFLRDKKITSLEDFKGLKIRSPGGLINQAIEALGMTPVSIPGQEIVSAMDKRIVDGAVYPFTDGVATKLYEVSKYVVDVGVAAVPAAIMMRKDVFAKLPPRHQQVVKAVGREYSTQLALHLSGADAKARETVRQAGVEILTLPPQELAKAAALKDIYPRWVAGLEKEGLPGRTTYQAYSDMLRSWGQGGLPDPK